MNWLYFRKLKFFDFRPKGVHHQLFEKKRFLSFFNSFLEHFLKSTPYFVRFGAINPNFKVLPLQTFIKMVLKRGKYFRVFSWISKPLVSLVIFFEFFFFLTCSEENYASNEWSFVNFGQKMLSLGQKNVVLGFCLINKPPKIS